MFYRYGSSLDLDLIIQSYEDERRRDWDNDEQSRKFLILIDQLARTLLRGSQDLIQPIGREATHPFSWEQVQFLTEQESISIHVLERLEIDVAWVLCTETRAMAYRCLDLAKIVATAQPNPVVLGFLRRLSRCYVAGFLPEAVMLCRSVLENAVKERVGTKHTMRERIATARQLGKLSSQASEAAMLIWTRGNAAVHEDSEATHDVTETIRLTTEVLSELYSSPLLTQPSR
ncbi:MAG: DUF4145 domain-containing protein [Longimicrobiaceae bacterium]